MPQTAPNQTANSPAAPPGGRRWPLNLHYKGSWVVIAAVVVGLVLVAILATPAKNKAPAIPAGQAQISITGVAFVPNTLNVKKDTQVTWTNNDTKPHQVAADPYPKNDSILGFDSDLVLQTGDSYSFTFIHPGTYTYHDQLNPFQLQGSVIVK